MAHYDHQRCLTDDTPEQFRRTTVLTVMKNPTRLRRVREFIAELEQYGVDLSSSSCPCRRRRGRPGRLNGCRRQRRHRLLPTRASWTCARSLPHHSYVMYTATPQAPLLVNLADILSPDFVIVLEPGHGYTGGEYFFEKHRATFVKRLTDTAVSEALDPGLVAPPDDLQLSLATYFLVLAQPEGAGPGLHAGAPFAQDRPAREVRPASCRTLTVQLAAAAQAGRARP